MLILGIDTATSQVGCAVGGHEGVIASAQCAKGRRHAENLAPQIRFVCDQADVDLSDIGVVAVDLGPGLFTGMRVGISTAKALAHALGVQMIGIPSLDLLAFPLRFTSRLVVAVIDARRGEVFYTFYRQVPGGMQRVSEHQVGRPDDVASQITALGEEVLMVGDGAQRYAENFDHVAGVEMAENTRSFPSARSLVQLAHAQALREQFHQPSELAPIYLRKPDVDIGWSTRDRP